MAALVLEINLIGTLIVHKKHSPRKLLVPYPEDPSKHYVKPESQAGSAVAQHATSTCH